MQIKKLFKRGNSIHVFGSILFIFTLLVVWTKFGFLVNSTNAMLIPANDNAKQVSQAPEHSPVIDETPDGNRDLVRVDFIHYISPNTNSVKTKTTSCYKLMGVKRLTLPVNYVINPTNSQGLSSDFVASAISTSAETWDNETSKELFSDFYSLDNSAAYGLQDNKNALAFGDYPKDNVIAITSVWYTRVGKQIVEFDQLYNTKFNWGDATNNPSVMDLQNIATHELGHAVGLDDIYNDLCANVTMYGYSDYGKTNERSLELPDIIGLQKMYGN